MKKILKQCPYCNHSSVSRGNEGNIFCSHCWEYLGNTIDLSDEDIAKGISLLDLSEIVIENCNCEVCNHLINIVYKGDTYEKNINNIISSN